jgi:hypothetical protein
MKIGYYCESPVDQAAMRVFTEGILGEPPEPINMDLEAHSVPGFFSALDGVFRGVHWNSDAEGLVVVVDCDDTDLHDPSHDTPGQAAENCRLCEIRKIITRARNQVKPRQGRLALKVAIGLAVPAVEAWYLVGTNHQVEEKAWRPDSKMGRPPRSRLKELVYGVSRPSLERKMECALNEARRIIRDLKAIEAAFPIGFGLMAQEIRSWTSQLSRPTSEEGQSGESS